MRLTHNKTFRFLSSYFCKTPFHPQWIIFRDNYKSILDLSDYIRGNVLDIGCGDGEIKKYLSRDINYFGIDYYHTSVHWYQSTPDIYADAQNIPVTGSSIDTVILLDVLEHVKNADKCINEISQILKKGGYLIIQIPFLYPVHDAPLDYKRWTIHGLKQLLEEHDLQVIKEIYKGQPFESSFLMINLAIGKTLVNWINKKNPLIVLGIFSPVIFFLVNVTSVLLTCVVPGDDFMPWAYRLVVKKE